MVAGRSTAQMLSLLTTVGRRVVIIVVVAAVAAATRLAIDQQLTLGIYTLLLACINAVLFILLDWMLRRIQREPRSYVAAAYGVGTLINVILFVALVLQLGRDFSVDRNVIGWVAVSVALFVAISMANYLGRR